MRASARLAAVLLVLIPQFAFSANLLVPTLELITRGYSAENKTVLGTRGSMEFLVEGGYKFGGRILLGFESDNLEDLTLERYLNFMGASVVMINPLGLPLEIAYFTGENDVFGTGDVFPVHYGTDPIASKFRGFLYFPAVEQVRYNGIHTVSGTGMKITSDFGSEWARAALYAYQDQYIGTGTYSVDIHGSINLLRFKLESFFGLSYPVTTPELTQTYLRAGLLLFYTTGVGGEFLTQIGVPRWDPANDDFTINLFYFLFEPRVRFGIFSIILTLFWHPMYYLQVETGELGSADINANFAFGNPQTSPVSGGAEAKLAFSTLGESQFSAVISPYFRTITSGVIWDFKVNAKLFPFSLDDIVEVFVGVRAAF